MEPVWPSGDVAVAGSVHAAVRAIVRDALGKRVGDTLATNTEVRESLGVGMGTVQRALEVLAERDALHTISRGHLGRRIEAVDIGQCWQAAGLPPIRILLSPPGSVEINSLETTIGDEFGRLGVAYTVRHLAGGNQRLELLGRGEYDLTVVSAGTFDGVIGADGSAAIVARRLASGTYYDPQRLVVLGRTDAATQARRVAIDTDSFDHEALTLAQFPPEPGREYVEVPYPDVPAFVLAGVVDAGIWHVTTSAVPVELAGLTVAQFSGEEAIATRDRLSGAAIAAWAGRPELRAVLDALGLDGLDAARAAAMEQEAASARRLRLALGRGRPGP